MPLLDRATTAAVHAALRRRPDLEYPGLPAADAADRLILDEAAPALAALADSREVTDPQAVVVIGDAYGGLALPLLAEPAISTTATATDGTDRPEASPAVGHLRLHQDMLTWEHALAANAADLHIPAAGFSHHDLGPQLLQGARLVLLRLPRSLAELEEIAQLIARHADPQVHLVAGGRDKYLTPAMNTVLARSFHDVRASRGRQKSRVLHARGARQPAPALTHPVRAHLPELGLDVVAHGGAFAGATLDLGTRALLAHLSAMKPDAVAAVDLGCGTGLLACALAAARPALRVTACDASWAAVSSARATVAVNALADRVAVRRADGLAGLPDASADLIVCNPPFHSGPALAPDAGLRLLRGAGRVLRPGGELWTVYNSRLGRSRELRRLVGPTRVVADDGRFTIACTTLASPSGGR